MASTPVATLDTTLHELPKGCNHGNSSTIPQPVDTEPSTAQGPSLDRLPAEMLVQIALQLQDGDFARLLQTNRWFHQILASHWVWHTRFVRRFGQHILLVELETLRQRARAAKASSTSAKTSSSVDTNSRTGESSITNSADPGQSSSNRLAASTNRPSFGRRARSETSSGASSATSSPPSSPSTSSPATFGQDAVFSPSGSSAESQADHDEDDVGQDFANDQDSPPSSDDKGKGKASTKTTKQRFDLKRTHDIPLERLIELYKTYSITIIPARDMSIAHMGTQFWRMQSSAKSRFGSLAILQSVWWLDVMAVFHGVPSGRYKVKWRMMVASQSPVVDSEFRVFVQDEGEDVDHNAPNDLFFQPATIGDFVHNTDSPATDVARTPFRRLFSQTGQDGFTMLEMPGELVIEDEYAPRVVVQIRNHNCNKIKSGMQLDYVKLVNVDNDANADDDDDNRVESGNETGYVNPEEYYPAEGTAGSPGGSTMGGSWTQGGPGTVRQYGGPRRISPGGPLSDQSSCVIH